MVTTLVLEKRVEELLKEWPLSGTIQVGILIGQRTKNKDFALSAVCTPSLKDLKETEGADEDKSSEDGFEDWWVLNHTKQVVSLLPGGIVVVGLFCICSKEKLPSLQPRLMKLLVELTSRDSKANLLHFCSLTKKLKGLVFDLKEQHLGFRPAEVKIQATPLQLVRVDSAITIDLDCYTCLHGNSSGDLFKSTQISVNKVLENLFHNARARVNGRLVNGSDPLVSKSKQQQPPDHIKLDLLTLRTPVELDGVECMEETRRLCLTGSVSLTAYLNSKATINEAIQALGEDASRSVASQLAALGETDSPVNTSTGVKLPIRVTVTTPSLPWALSEYSLPGEDINECEARVCDLLGVKDVVCTLPDNYSQQQTTENPSKANEATSNNGLWMVVAALIFLFISIATWAVLNN